MSVILTTAEERYVWLRAPRRQGGALGFREKELTGAGFTAAVRTASGEAVVKRTFDPNAEETLFFPRLIGG